MFKKGQTVRYTDQCGGENEARVRVVHRDGSVTVEATFAIEDGKWVGGYLGYKYRMGAEKLRAA